MSAMMEVAGTATPFGSMKWPIIQGNAKIHPSRIREDLILIQEKDSMRSVAKLLLIPNKFSG